MQNLPADDLEIISIGALYKGSSWDKKYWSSSRGKDRYPYPVGYRAARNHNGNTYKMEVCEGVKGPSFVITSTDGESCSGQTPDMAWENFQKKSAPRAKLGNGKRFSCKIDGVEFFGFRNAIVQRMLRELVSNVNGTAERNLLSPNFCNEAGRVEPDAQTPESCKHPEVLPSSIKSRSTRKRSRKVKTATIDSASGPELKKLQQDVSDTKFFVTRKDQDDFNGEKYFTSISNEDCQVDENTKSFIKAVETNKVLDRKNNSFSVKGGSSLKSRKFAKPLKKDVNALQEQKTVYSEDHSFTSPVNYLSKREEQIDTLLGGDTQGRNSLEATKDDFGETMSMAESKTVGLCAPDSLDLLQDTTSDSAPECKRASPGQVKNEFDASAVVLPEEMARSLEGEDEVGTYASSGSSEKSSDDSVGQELANSMMTLLLPQALPLLKKTSGRKRAKAHVSEICFTNGDACLNLAAMNSFIGSDLMHHTTNILSPGEREVGMLLEGSPKDTEGKLSNTNLYLDAQSLEDVKSIVPDSFEDEQSGNHPNNQRSHRGDCIEVDEAFSSKNDCNPGSVRLPGSFFAQQASSNVHVGVHESCDIVCEKVPVVVNDNLKKDEILRSESCLRCIPANRQIHLKEKSENVFINSDKNLICDETLPRVDELMSKDAGPIKDIPALEPTFVAHTTTQLVQGDSTANCVIPNLGPVDTLSSKGAAHGANMVSLNSDTAYVEKVLPVNSTKNVENLSKASLNNKLVPYRRRYRSTGKRFQNSNNHENHYTTAAKQVFATRDVKDVNGIVCVSSVHMSEMEADATDTNDSINSKTPVSRQRPGLHPTRKFRVPFIESIICRNTRDECVPESEMLVPTEFAQSSAAGDSLGRKVSSQCEVKCDGNYKNLSTEVDIVRSSSMVSQAQEVVDYAAKDKDIIDGKKYQAVAITEDTYCSSLFQDREKNLFFDDTVHGTEEKLAKLNVHPATGSGQDSGTQSALHKECLLLDQFFSFDTKLNRASEDFIKLVGCYVQPTPILSVVLSMQGDDIHISVLCGILADRLRTIFIYKVPLREPRRGCPAFLGYTSIMLPISKYTFSGEIAFERLSMQFTPDGQLLVFSNSFKAPYCRKQSIHCLCDLCTTNGFEENAIKLIHVKLGYVSLVAKLKTEDTVHSVLVCEPSHLVALEKNGRVQVWVMNSQWSERVEEYILPSLHHMSPCLVELKKSPKHPSLVIGHNGFGEFVLWDISKRIMLSRFSAPRNCIFQFLPVGLFGWKREPARASLNVEEQIKGIISATERWISGISEDLDFLSFNGEDIAVWLLVSSLCDSEVENVSQTNGVNISADGCWRLALLVDSMVILGSALDPRASVVDALEGCGIVATHDGLVYVWELSTGLKLADLHHFKSGRVSCISTDSKAGVLAVAGDENQLMVYAVLRPATEGLNK